MSEVKVTVGGGIEGEISQRFIDAWHRAERGEAFEERHLAFENWDTLARVLTGKRMESLSHVRRHKITSIRALAKALQRDYSNVHADVQALYQRRTFGIQTRQHPRQLRLYRNQNRDLIAWSPILRQLYRF